MRRHALFVGINDYDSCPLDYARADAQLLHKHFHRYYDTATVLLDRQASENQIKERLKSLRVASARGDMLVFYFSGHGGQLNGVRYLNVPEYDEDGDQTSIGRISLGDIEKITRKKGVHRLFILDCCRNDAEEEDDSEDDGVSFLLGITPSIGVGLLPNAKFADYVVRHRTGVQMPPVILSSSMPGQSSYEDPKSGHGFFTEALIETINSETVRSFNDFRNYLDHVMTTFDLPDVQTPYFEGPIGADLPFWPTWTQRDDRRTEDSTERKSLSITDVQRVFRRVRCDGFYIGRKIPPEMRRNAWNKMRMVGQEHEILALYDDASFWGHGEEGFAVTPEGVYMRNFLEEPVFIPWTDVEWAYEYDSHLQVNEYSGDISKASSAAVIEAIARGIMKLSTQYENMNDGDMSVEWRPGDAHPEWPHIVASTEKGIWTPAAGYDWVDPDDDDDMSVKWKPGKEHPEWPHVVADKKKGIWTPAAGYDWVDPDDDDDMSVERKPGRE